MLFAISYLAVAQNKCIVAWNYGFVGLLFPEGDKTCMSEVQSLIMDVFRKRVRTLYDVSETLKKLSRTNKA